jgi:hypothetical protein
MSLDLWPSDVYGEEGSPPENIDAICEAIHDATKGFGTNEKYEQCRCTCVFQFYFVPNRLPFTHLYHLNAYLSINFS